MTRYIDVEALKNDGHPCWHDGKGNIYYEVDHAPTADVVECKHGEWLKEGCCFYCSECKATYGFGSTRTIYDVKRHWLHCPQCGAIMDGGNAE